MFDTFIADAQHAVNSFAAHARGLVAPVERRCEPDAVRSYPVFDGDANKLARCPEWLNTIIPGHQRVVIEGDGRYWLRCICVGVEPGKVLIERQLQHVRVQLYEELCRWGTLRWIQHVPLYSLRDILVSRLAEDDDRTSYDLYKEYLSLSDHTYRHLDHVVLYIASALLNVEFIIVARLQGTSHHPPSYHRRTQAIG